VIILANMCSTDEAWNNANRNLVWKLIKQPLGRQEQKGKKYILQLAACMLQVEG
jgi:hypothetical protein